MAITEMDLQSAQARVAEQVQAGCAISARYDRRSSRIVVHMSTGIELAFPISLAEGLKGAAPADLAQIEISPTGLGLRWPTLDADLYVPALLQGVLGSKRWMAAHTDINKSQVKSNKKISPSRPDTRSRKLAGS